VLATGLTAHCERIDNTLSTTVSLSPFTPHTRTFITELNYHSDPIMKHMSWWKERKAKLATCRFQRIEPELLSETSTSRLQHIEPELLAMILIFLVGASEDFSTASDAAIISRASALCTIGLVCRSWQGLSRDFLYAHPRPQSLKALKQLHKLLRMKNGLAQRVKSLSPPIFDASLQPWSSLRDWRPGYLRPKVGLGILLSMNDYFSMFRMFGEVAMMCPNLSHFSLPMLLEYELLVIPPEFCPRQVISRITSLTLSSLPFCRLKEGGPPLSGLLPLYLPSLKRCKLINTTDLVMDTMATIADCIHTPVLEEITISGMFRTCSALGKFLKPVEGTLVSLDILNARIDRGWHPNFPQAPLTPKNIKHLAIYARYRSETSPDEMMLRLDRTLRFELKTVPSLETLRLHAQFDSSLIELDYFYPSLQVLCIKYSDPSRWLSTDKRDKGNFHLVDSLAHFVKNKDLFAPQLREITLNWTLPTMENDLKVAVDWLAFLLANYLQGKCEKYGVKLDWRMGCCMLFCPSYERSLNKVWNL
jgi:hypothetical protein